MRTLIDNTSIHAVARCLARTARSEDDPQTLLDIALNLLLADELLVSMFEINFVRVDTDVALSYLRDEVDSNIPGMFFKFEPSEEQFRMACERTSGAVLDYLEQILEGSIEWPRIYGKPIAATGFSPVYIPSELETLLEKGLEDPWYIESIRNTGIHKKTRSRQHLSLQMTIVL
jgi:hypothetical protein